LVNLNLLKQVDTDGCRLLRHLWKI